MANLIHKEKRLAYLLRHDPNIDIHGWRAVQDLVENHGFSREELVSIVATSNKQRFEFSKDMSCIRACQGHSVKVDVELEEAVPPEYLYHGTAKGFVDSILKLGILKGKRLYVHLSSTVEMAMKVGARHGEPVVLTINAKRMSEDGIRFLLSHNGVWLTEFVDARYITIQ
jgi:putative RNA 2'-phosphotransferase